MENAHHGDNVIVDFWQWFQRGHEYRRGPPLARYALDKCEESFKKREWSNFSYWHTIYIRERSKAPKQGRESYRS